MPIYPKVIPTPSSSVYVQIPSEHLENTGSTTAEYETVLTFDANFRGLLYIDLMNTGASALDYRVVEKAFFGATLEHEAVAESSLAANTQLTDPIKLTAHAGVFELQVKSATETTFVAEGSAK